VPASPQAQAKPVGTPQKLSQLRSPAAHAQSSPDLAARILARAEKEERRQKEERQREAREREERALRIAALLNEQKEDEQEVADSLTKL
jgi:hypothetical protein